MNRLLRVSVAILFVAFCFVNAVGQTAAKADAAAHPKVTVANSELVTMKSASTGRDYDIYVHVPANFKKDGDKRYPVVYVLDGQWDFKTSDSILGGLVYDKFAPDMVLVGMSYSGENPDYNELRAMDLTPTPTARVKGSGDAPKFLKFIKTELMPYIESSYRGDPSRRILQGCSYAGLFTLYTLFTEPELFSGYIASSPAVTYDGNFMFKKEAEYAKQHKQLNAKVFIGVGQDEELAGPVQKFMKTLESRGYKGLMLKTRVAEGERHSSNKPEVYNRGMRFLFSDYKAPSSAAK